MINSDAVIRYCEAVYAIRPIYLWGADMQVITKDFLNKLISKFGANHYTDIDLKKHEGMYGADCSGMLTNISGVDMTASGYYSKCSNKGMAKYAPKNKVYLIFREEKGSIVHVALLNGYTYELYEMWDGCEKRKFDASEWTYYGIPDWIEQKDVVKLIKDTYVYMSASAAKEGRMPSAVYHPGEYYIYKRVTGAINITKTLGVPGGWIAEVER